MQKICKKFAKKLQKSCKKVAKKLQKFCKKICKIFADFLQNFCNCTFCKKFCTLDHVKSPLLISNFTLTFFTISTAAEVKNQDTTLLLWWQITFVDLRSRLIKAFHNGINDTMTLTTIQPHDGPTWQKATTLWAF